MAAVPDGKFMSLPVHEENSRLWNTRKAGPVQLNEMYSRSKRKYIFRRVLLWRKIPGATNLVKTLGYLNLSNKMAGANIAAEILQHFKIILSFCFSLRFCTSFDLHLGITPVPLLLQQWRSVRDILCFTQKPLLPSSWPEIRSTAVDGLRRMNHIDWKPSLLNHRNQSSRRVETTSLPQNLEGFVILHWVMYRHSFGVLPPVPPKSLDPYLLYLSSTTYLQSLPWITHLGKC